jgi:hypothetical protein
VSYFQFGGYNPLCQAKKFLGKNVPLPKGKEDIFITMEYIITESQLQRIISEQPDSHFGLERFGYNPDKPETTNKAIESQRELHNSKLYRTLLQTITAFVPIVGPSLSMGLMGMDVKRDYDNASTKEEKGNIILSYVIGMAFVWGLGKVFKSVASLGETGMKQLSKKISRGLPYSSLSTQEAAVIFEVTSGQQFWIDKLKKK